MSSWRSIRHTFTFCTELKNGAATTQFNWKKSSSSRWSNRHTFTLFIELKDGVNPTTVQSSNISWNPIQSMTFTRLHTWWHLRTSWRNVFVSLVVPVANFNFFLNRILYCHGKYATLTRSMLNFLLTLFQIWITRFKTHNISRQLK